MKRFFKYSCHMFYNIHRNCCMPWRLYIRQDTWRSIQVLQQVSIICVIDLIYRYNLVSYLTIFQTLNHVYGTSFVIFMIDFLWRIVFHLYYRDYPNNDLVIFASESIEATALGWRQNTQVKIITHGWLGDGNSPDIQDILHGW